MEETEKKKILLRFAELQMKQSRGAISEEEIGEMRSVSDNLQMSPSDIMREVASLVS